MGRFSNWQLEDGMKHYHGTPIGGKAANADDFAEGRLLLIPWRRTDDLQRAMQVSAGFCVDNSAFTFWRNGESPKWEEYIKWLRPISRNPRFDFALIPDVIDGSEGDNRDLIRMWDRMAWHPTRILGCPVWHLHESLERLDRLCKSWDRVAIGSSGEWPTPGVGSWWDRMDEAFEVICDEDGFPRSKIHGLRMLRPSIIETYPFASCDSTNAAQNGSRESQKNKVDSIWGSKTIARRIELVRSPSRWEKRRGSQLQLEEFAGEAKGV